MSRLNDALKGCRKLAVLLSGGVDSSLLAAAAARALGAGNVLALTASSPLTTEGDTQAAAEVAALLAVRHRVLAFDALALPEVAGNLPERCHACKREIIRLAQEIAQAEGFGLLAEGSNADDLEEERPGMRAVREAGVLSPLAAAGLRKPEVRELARGLGLAVWDRPSSPCLATRFPTGHRLLEDELALVARAERSVRAMGLAIVRLRHRGPGLVALECGPQELATARSLAEAIEASLAALNLALAGPPLPYGANRKPPPEAAGAMASHL